jgi:hypothetical protein
MRYRRRVVSLGLTARPSTPHPTIGKKTTTASNYNGAAKITAFFKVKLSRHKTTYTIENKVTHMRWNKSPTESGSCRTNTVSANASPSGFGNGDNWLFNAMMLRRARIAPVVMPTTTAFHHSRRLKA